MSPIRYKSIAGTIDGGYFDQASVVWLTGKITFGPTHVTHLIWRNESQQFSFPIMAWVVQLPSSWLLWCRFKFLHNLMNGDRLVRCTIFIYNLTFSRPVGKSNYNMLARSPRRDLWFGMLKIYIIVIWPRCRWWLLTSMKNTFYGTLCH